MTVIQLYWLSLSVLVAVIVAVIWVSASKRRSMKRSVEAHKTEFFSLVAHYFMTPLSIIRGNVSELIDPSSASLSKSQLITYYLNIQVSAARLIMLVQNIMTVSEIDQQTISLNPTAVNLMDVIDKCITEVHSEAMQRGVNIRFDRTLEESASQVTIDPEKFRQALINILHNSVKFTRPGGNIQVTLKTSSNSFEIQVADSGIGISKDEMTKLFTRFHRGTSYLNLDYEGVGLGLYIAKYLIELNRGQIRVDSELDKGTVVTINLIK
ncbi:MAG: HAMP domain-containing sensor histidine kinase [Patescibacteria group bacterium]|jgi:two-component system phosphate regulon sensor histidine kinase PhoR